VKKIKIGDLVQAKIGYHPHDTIMVCIGLRVGAWGDLIVRVMLPNGGVLTYYAYDIMVLA